MNFSNGDRAELFLFSKFSQVAYPLLNLTERSRCLLEILMYLQMSVDPDILPNLTISSEAPKTTNGFLSVRMILDGKLIEIVISSRHFPFQ